MDQPVPYDASGSAWRLARQWANLPNTMLSESAVFTPRKNAPKNVASTKDATQCAQEEQRIKIIEETYEQRIEDLVRDYDQLWSQHIMLMSKYESLLSRVDQG
tara:strand:- start:71 stop:379 length:309 start_codon:yes stop_codon:yes gene_type:complete